MTAEPGSLTAAFADEAAKFANPDDVPGAVMGGGTVEQLDMLRDPVSGKLPGDAFVRMRNMSRGAGRPPNARNMRNRDAAKLMVQQYGDPLQFLGRTYSQPLDQLVEMLLIAEGVPDREDRLLSLCDRVDELAAQAAREGITGDRLKALDKLILTIERAATALKSKPGEIALKALALQVTAAKEANPYVNSKKPVEIVHTDKRDAVILMPAPQTAVADPVGEAMKRTAEAINAGSVTPTQIMDMRFNADTHVYEVPDEEEGE